MLSVTWVLLLWTSTDRKLVSRVAPLYEGDPVLLVNDVYAPEQADIHGRPDLQDAISLVPDHLKREMLSVLAPYTYDDIRPMLVGRTVFETHSDVVADFMGDEYSDNNYALAKERWIRGLNDCLQVHMRKDQFRLVVLYGQNPDPLPFYLSSILLSLGVTSVRMTVVYNRPRGGDIVPAFRDLPTSSFVDLLDPETFALLMCHFFAHQAAYPEEQHPALNVARITTKMLNNGMARYLPPDRGTSRTFDGIKKSLKNVSFEMEKEGILKRVVSSDHNFRLTPLGHFYSRIVFGMRNRIKETLSEHEKDESALMKLIEDFDIISKVWGA
jgi:hypothetical protein